MLSMLTQHLTGSYMHFVSYSYPIRNRPTVIRNNFDTEKSTSYSLVIYSFTLGPTFYIDLESSYSEITNRH